MAIMDDYKDALKLGQKAYREAVTKGNFPYLPALEELIPYTSIEAEVNLGLLEIPMNLIVGTKTAGRTNSFANNFMPLLGIDSEFALKWANLSNMLQEEGLRDPVRAYEYMNHFYILEGNKRVSVMKYLGAVSIPGTVVRVVPKRNNTKENKLYYEFMSFYQYTGINYVGFSELGSYKKLQQAVGKGVEEDWTEDEKREFHSFYIRFEKAYKEKCGSQMPMDVAGAMLIYLNLYEYEMAKEQLPGAIKENLVKIWDEFLFHSDGKSVELSMTPTTEGRRTLLSKLFSDTKSVYRIGFIHDKSADTSGWTYGHELGRRHLEQKFPGKIFTTVYEHVNPVDTDVAAAIIEEAINDGNDIIFTTTPKLLKASMKAAIEHPDVKIMNCSLYTTHPYVRTYYARMYEAKFVMGAIAGAMAENNKIGYIADYPIYGMTANINAFALGAKMVNPRAEIYLEWSTIKEHHVRESLRQKDVHYISDRDLIVPQKVSREFGLYHEENGKPENLAMPVWHWGKFYELILRSIFKGSWKDYEPAGGTKALNFWWGMSAEVIDVISSQNLPKGTTRLVELLKKTIISGEFHPFAGDLYDQNGEKKHAGTETMAPEDIIKMDWLVDNIIGYIPSMAELTEEAKEIVAIQGIKKEDIIG